MLDIDAAIKEGTFYAKEKREEVRDALEHAKRVSFRWQDDGTGLETLQILLHVDNKNYPHSNSLLAQGIVDLFNQFLIDKGIKQTWHGRTEGSSCGFTMPNEVGEGAIIPIDTGVKKNPWNEEDIVPLLGEFLQELRSHSKVREPLPHDRFMEGFPALQEEMGLRMDAASTHRLFHLGSDIYDSNANALRKVDDIGREALTRIKALEVKFNKAEPDKGK